MSSRFPFRLLFLLFAFEFMTTLFKIISLVLDEEKKKKKKTIKRIKSTTSLIKKHRRTREALKFLKSNIEFRKFTERS